MIKVKMKKWMLVLFSVLCIGSLLIPNKALFREKENAAVVRKENRTITALPPFKPRKKDFYLQLEKAYQDRLYKREKIIYFWKRSLFDIGVLDQKKGFCIGKNGWLFPKSSVGKVVDKEIKMEKLQRFQQYCKEHGADFVLLVPPRKFAIYSEYVPKKFLMKYKDYGLVEKEWTEATEQFGVNYVSVYEDLLKAKQLYKDPVCWWDDHHYSYLGTAVVTDKLLKYFRNFGYFTDYEKLPFDGTLREAPKEHCDTKSLGIDKQGYSDREMIRWSQLFTDNIWFSSTKVGSKISKPECQQSDGLLRAKGIDNARGETIIENRDNENGITILMLGDSFSRYIAMYLCQYAKVLIGCHATACIDQKKYNDMEYLIERYKPNIVIYQPAWGSISQSGKTYMEKIKF